MKPTATFRSLSVGTLLAASTLVGCSGNFAAFPDVPTRISPGAIQGSVFGGHAPIVNAHVYVLEAGQSGYGSAASSELTSGDGLDSIGYYVKTDASGSFNITGKYSCDYSPTAGGHPVYLAASGGSVNQSFTTTFGSSTATGSGGPPYRSAPFTLTFSGRNIFYAGQTISFPATGQPGALTGYYAALNGTTQTVTTSTPSSFVIVTSTPSGSIVGTSTAGDALSVPTPNPAIVNLAVLGNCPGTTNEFASTLSFVYMNEVSTVAAAQALGAFGTGPFNIGSKATNLIGIQNAAVNAGQLYDIQGSNFTISSPYVGEGHIARSHTPAGNGNVPQSTLDTLGNILASCVDSGNTANSAANPTATGASINCGQLFTYATNNGVPYGSTGAGTVPTDTATAAFNIARYPAGAALYSTGSGVFMSKLFALQGSQAIPFSPYLSTAPNDFTIAIQYTSALNSYLGKAESIAVDSTGSVWISAQSNDVLFKWSPVGVLQTSHNAAGYFFGYLSVDPSNNVWSANGNVTSVLTELSPSGTVLSATPPALPAVNGYAGPYTNAYTTVTDQFGDAFVLSRVGGGNNITTVYPGGTLAGTTSLAPYGVPSGSDTAHGAYDSTGALWITSEGGSQIDRLNFLTGASYAGFPITFGSNVQPEFPGIDHNNTAWIAVQFSNIVDEVTAAGVVTNPTGATLNKPFGSAVDGLGNVWISNRGNNSIVEYNGATGVAISPTANYTLGGTLNDSLNLAIDPSGDLWITNYGGGEVVELIGPAAPVLTPLAAAAGGNMLGVEP